MCCSMFVLLRSNRRCHQPGPRLRSSAAGSVSGGNSQLDTASHTAQEVQHSSEEGPGQPLIDSARQESQRAQQC